MHKNHFWATRSNFFYYGHRAVVIFFTTATIFNEITVQYPVRIFGPVPGFRKKTLAMMHSLFYPYALILEKSAKRGTMTRFSGVPNRDQRVFRKKNMKSSVA